MVALGSFEWSRPSVWPASCVTVFCTSVETHLANVYAKLGVRSKVELARRASELALNQ